MAKYACEYAPWPAACGNEGDYMNIKSKRTFLAAVVLLLILILFAFMYQRKKSDRSTGTYKQNGLSAEYHCHSHSLRFPGRGNPGRRPGTFAENMTIFSALPPRPVKIYQLNHGELPVDEDGFYELSEKTADVISHGLSYCELSDGAFDIAIEPVSSLWGFYLRKRKST